jgi:MFS family permease
MPAASARSTARQAVGLGALFEPFGDGRFVRLLLFGCWFSFFNGVTQSAQNYFPMQVLGVSLFLSLALQTGMRLGQWTISPRLGAVADRWGNRPVMIVSQLLVAAGLLFFAVATPAHWMWFVGAWVLWIAYAGMNVCLPNLMLKLSPECGNAPYIAAFYAVTGLCYAASTIVGGAVVDRFGAWTMALGGCQLTFFACLFLFGWLLRSLGAVVLLSIREPTGRRAGDR